jgi:hypothetical protein
MVRVCQIFVGDCGLLKFWGIREQNELSMFVGTRAAGLGSVGLL